MPNKLFNSEFTFEEDATAVAAAAPSTRRRNVDTNKRQHSAESDAEADESFGPSEANDIEHLIKKQGKLSVCKVNIT